MRTSKRCSSPHMWTPDFSTELKVSQRDYESQPFPLNGVRLPAVGLRFSGALPPDAPSGVSANNRFLNFGTENSRHFNVLETKTTDIYGGATWTLGAHEIKFGLDFAVFARSLDEVGGEWCQSRLEVRRDNVPRVN